MKLAVLITWFLAAVTTPGQLAVSLSPPSITGSKAVVKLTLKNAFPEKIDSARAAVFLLDEQGKMVGQATRWVIGGGPTSPGLAPGATNTFNFVISGHKPFTTTNLTVKANFTRILLEGGKPVDPTRAVEVNRK